MSLVILISEAAHRTGVAWLLTSRTTASPLSVANLVRTVIILVPSSCMILPCCSSTSAWASSWLRVKVLVLASISVFSFVCATRSEEHTSELQSLRHLVCRLLLEKKKSSDHTFLFPLLSDFRSAVRMCLLSFPGRSSADLTTWLRHVLPRLRPMLFFFF